ncbi:MAG TPA: HAMP domain-containing sensor histidine kinase [Anaeromyxobacter sp.]|nr:HAMP domain-containing sensor histidine kinase [Anaeromyxobacter sp.]
MSLAQPSRCDLLPRGHRTALPDARRAAPAELAREIEATSRSPVVIALLEAVDAVLLVLDERRQIVAFSGGAARAAGSADLAGRRPGEALACVNAQPPAGCGATPACQTCGALGAILGAHESGRPTDAECLLRSVAGGGAAHEFSVRASPVRIEGERYIVLSFRDLSGEKRREALEQVFVHDLLNTVTGLRGWSTRLRAPGCDVARVGERVDFLTRQLEREIRDHRDLALAEAGSLAVARRPVEVAELLRDLEAVFSWHSVARERRLAVEAVPGLALETDPSLLLRVLVNMVRNAFEATPAGGAVSLRVEREEGGGGPDGALRFSVHNQAAMPEEVQHRVFTRSFSTKGEAGRGLGTYGMKLLGERHLGGQVAFASSTAAGTTFWIRLPRSGPLPARAAGTRAPQRASHDPGPSRGERA